jgi:hypothetical protein
MNQRRSLWHKVAYAAAIVVLLLPLSYLSQPKTRESSGGKLAQLREDYHLSQADLGEIDPTSETLKLATLGMRGIAANIMWHKANEYKKTENWTGFSAALEQIIRLQPNFIAVWRFQAWNLSYNISVEFDDYHDRYYWVMKGINFIIGGTKYNANEPRLLYDIGWFISQKIGRADEHDQFRKLLKQDDDFFNLHAAEMGNLTPQERDNWLVGRRWYLKAQQVVDTRGVPIKGTSPLIFHSYPAMSLINYAEALEDDGTYGEVAQNAWHKAREGWRQFGDRDIPTSYNVNIHLNDRERLEKKSQDVAAELDKLVPTGAEEVRKEKITKLTEEERANLEIPADKLTGPQAYERSLIEKQIRPSFNEIAQRAATADRLEALRLAEVAAAAENSAGIIDRYREVVNFDYWRLRCDMEQTKPALEAHKLIHDADAAFKAAHLEPAKENYEKGFAQWRIVLDTYPALMKESTVVDDLNEMIDRYRELLGHFEMQLPGDFVLQDVVKAKGRVAPPATVESQDVTGDPSQPAEPKKKPEAESAEPQP